MNIFIWSFLAFAVGLFIGHKAALMGLLAEIHDLETAHANLKRLYNDAYESAKLAEKSFNKAFEEYQAMKEDIKKLVD